MSTILAGDLLAQAANDGNSGYPPSIIVATGQYDDWESSRHEMMAMTERALISLETIYQHHDLSYGFEADVEDDEMQGDVQKGGRHA